jgi:hypothetical protein
MLSAFSSQAVMSQTTRNVINGTAPYLTFDGGLTRATNVDKLLGITLPSGTHIIPNTNTSGLSNPIELPNASDNLVDIIMPVPVGTDSVELSKLIGPPNNYWGDDDGDSDFTVTGSLTLSIVDKEGHEVDRRDTLDICRAPYKVTLSSSGGTLSTRYGFPNSSNFSASSAIYYINPKASPEVCFVRPSLQYGSNNEHDFSGHNFAGPLNIWNPDKGFLIQSTAPAHYDRNFPTTGAHNLYFDLDIGGVNVGQLSWSSVTHHGITASMTPDSSRARVRVTLTGPHATSAQQISDSPGNIPRPSLPAIFELVGRDGSGRAVVKYGFELKQWFVNRGDALNNYSSSSSWCNSIGYQMPRVRDLTNARCTGINSGYLCQGSVGALPSSSGNHYQRRIGSGFFTEWGYMRTYTGANFDNFYYWTGDVIGYNQFEVSSHNGRINRDGVKYLHYVVCASVLRL